MVPIYLRDFSSHVARLFAAVTIGLFTPLVAHAQQGSSAYEEGLETFWQSLRGQGSVPTPVIKWIGPVKYHFSGAANAAQRKHILQSLAQMTKITGVVFEDASELGKTHEDIRLVIEVANGGNGLSIETPCYVEHQAVSAFRLQKVLLRMSKGAVMQCTMHEIMHVVGIVGHPNGDTQLSYTPKQKHAYTQLDQLLLQTWYSDRLRPGMTPFEAISILSEQWMLLNLEKDNQAEATRNSFLTRIFDNAVTPPKPLALIHRTAPTRDQ
jgi:hypothetical protein